MSAFNVEKRPGESLLMLKNDPGSHFLTGSLFNVTPAKENALTKRPLSGVRLQNNVKAKGEKLFHFSHVLKKALDELYKLRII